MKTMRFLNLSGIVTSNSPFLGFQTIL